MDKPAVKLADGRRIKYSYEDADFFYYYARTQDVAKEICHNLIRMGFTARTGRSTHRRRYFVKVMKDELKW